MPISPDDLAAAPVYWQRSGGSDHGNAIFRKSAAGFFCENSSKPMDLSRFQGLGSGSPARMAAGEADEIIGNCAFRPVETGLFLCFPKRLLCGWREASGKVRTMSAELKTGAEMLIRALKDKRADIIFVHHGGDVLRHYEALF